MVFAIVLLCSGEFPPSIAVCITSMISTAVNGIVIVAAGDEQGIGEQNSVFEDSHV